jgi:ariadne-1
VLGSSCHRGSCGHTFCYSCWRTYLTGKITDGSVVDLRCPSCSRSIDRTEIQQSVSEVILKKYDVFLENVELAKDPAVRWCPTPNCSSILRGSAGSPHLVCPKCSAETCWNCNERWHGSRSCEEAADAAMKDYMKNNAVKRCPKCKAPTIKEEGCKENAVLPQPQSSPRSLTTSFHLFSLILAP